VLCLLESYQRDTCLPALQRTYFSKLCAHLSRFPITHRSIFFNDAGAQEFYEGREDKNISLRQEVSFLLNNHGMFIP